MPRLTVLEIDMKNGEKAVPEWINRGKSIRGLIKELQSFDDQDLEVQISVDDGNVRRPISLVGKVDGKCLLVYKG